MGSIILVAAWKFKVFRRPEKTTKNELDFYVVVISLVGATLWSQDSILPLSYVSEGIVFKPWTDSFYHARVISEIVNWSGGVPLGHLAIAGQTSAAYHYAGYTSPAILSAVTNLHSYFAFTGFQVPFGVFLTGLAAYVLMSLFWGKRAGLIAPIVLLLLPDAAQQGIHNNWLSYHWLQQIAPNGMYGIVVCVMAWIFMYQGCRKTDYRAIIVSYVFLLLSLSYKAQIFVPNAILLWLWSPLFVRRIKLYQRVLWFTVAVAILCSAMSFSQQDTRVPTLLFDGSAFKAYSQNVISFFDPGWANHVVIWLQSLQPGTTVWEASINAVTIYIGTFGVWGILAPYIAGVYRHKMSRDAFWFPVAIMGLYLSMACLLAFDAKGVGTREELLHRPFVWAYFISCIWSSSALFYFMSQRMKTWFLQPQVLVILCLVLSLVPWTLGGGVEKGPPFGKEYANIFVAQGQFEACRYIREQATVSDVLLDSQFDPRLIVTALSERQSYFMNPIYGNSTLPHYEERLALVQELVGIDSVEKLREFQIRQRVDWYLLHPNDTVNWPLAIVMQPEFDYNGYRVYHLTSLLKF